MSAKASGNIELAKKYLRMAKVSCVIIVYPVLQCCISVCVEFKCLVRIFIAEYCAVGDVCKDDCFFAIFAAGI